MEDNPWGNPKVIAELERLYSQTRISFREIAISLNSLFGLQLSRNAVIGKTGRLGFLKKYPLSARKSPGGLRRESRRGVNLGGGVTKARSGGRQHREALSLPAVREIQEEPVSVTETKPEEKAVLYTEHGPRGWPVSIFRLSASTCHWPLAAFKDQPPYMYCGKNTVENSPYCREHYSKAYTRPPPKRPK